MNNEIKLEIKGASPMEIDRYGKLILTIVSNGGLDVKYGATILYWQNGMLDNMEIRTIPYRRKKLDKTSNKNL